MKNFRCNHCEQVVYFENVACVSCGRVLGFVPQYLRMATFEPADATSPPAATGADPGAGPASRLWRSRDGGAYRQCANYAVEHVCNWMVPAADPDAFCIACRLNDTVPDMSVPGNRALWGLMETAKRRLIYTLLAMRLPVQPRSVDPEGGLVCSFMASTPRHQVMTGHDNGHIVINVAEADDAVREKNRKAMGEPYRTLLGHFRHEIGHYYWDRLVAGTEFLEPFRGLFGDERLDYQEALDRHYREGAPADWQDRFVSEYATMHPWEDWAETWAHFMHMADTLETAKALGLVLMPQDEPEPTLELNAERRQAVVARTFQEMRDQWIPLTVALNSLTRSMGTGDAYPFVLSKPALDKLAFVHQLVVHRSAVAA